MAWYFNDDDALALGIMAAVSFAVIIAVVGALCDAPKLHLRCC